MTCKEAVGQASRIIEGRDAELLLRHVLHKDRAWLLAHGGDPLPAGQEAAFFRLVELRAKHTPVQYLTGRQEFFGLELHVGPEVLIPRPETELLVEAVLAWCGDQPVPGRLQLVDVGTGSGAIALALASQLDAACITAVDVSQAALTVASANAKRLGLTSRVRFVASDLLVSLRPGKGGGTVDGIVSNPPYVPTADAPGLGAEVRDFEPHLALFGGTDGLAVYRRLIPQARAVLRGGGLLAMEFGFGQREELAALLIGWKRVRFVDDYAGIPRVVLAERA